MLVRPLLALALVAIASPAEAAVCVLSLPTAGVLTLSSDGLRLGSEEAAVPTPGTLTVVTIGSATLTVDPPILTQAPAGYQSASETRETRFTAPVTGGSKPYATTPQAIAVPNLLGSAVILTIHNRITNPVGFAAGTYATRTVVTCS
jgi:hypothetical protein